MYNNICNFGARLCKGSTTDSDSVCLGSNPSRATIFLFNLILYVEAWLWFGSIELDRRRWRIQGKRNGEAVKISRRTGERNFGHRKSKLRSSAGLSLCCSFDILFNLILYVEAWLSLVERCVRDAEAVGSNPVASTI